MSIQSVSSQVQSEELYVIRKKSEQVQESAKSAEQVQEQTQVQAAQTDTYDKANPVGEEAEGVYSVSHDESGNLTVNYKPTAKSEAKAESQTSGKTEQAGEGQPAQSGGAAPVTSSSDDDDDEELEELKEQRDALRQQLNRAADEETKQALRVQLQSVELQIAMKSAE